MKTTNQIDREANEKKAKEIATIDAGDGRKIFSGECYYAALEAMEWKDKEHKQERQQMIDKACKWLLLHDSDAKPTYLQVDRLREHLNKMKGE